MDKEFTYKDRVTFYKKDMWRASAIYKCLVDEIAEAKRNGKNEIRIGRCDVKIEAVEGFIKCLEVDNILHERMRAAAAILNMPSPNDVHFLDTDADAEAKRIAEEKLWRKQRDADYEKSVREEAEKQKRKGKK